MSPKARFVSAGCRSVHAGIADDRLSLAVSTKPLLLAQAAGDPDDAAELVGGQQTATPQVHPAPKSKSSLAQNIEITQPSNGDPNVKSHSNCLVTGLVSDGELAWPPEVTYVNLDPQPNITFSKIDVISWSFHFHSDYAGKDGQEVRVTVTHSENSGVTDSVTFTLNR